VKSLKLKTKLLYLLLLVGFDLVVQLVFFLGVILALVMGLAWTIFARIEVQQQHRWNMYCPYG
jgi:hypothetical protein